MTKLLHVIHDFLNGGIESFLFYLSQEQLTNKNLEVTILCLQEEHKITNPRIKSLPLKIIYIPIPPFGKSFKRYREFLRTINDYDIVHWHTFKPNLAFLSRFSNTKHVYTVHSAGTLLRQKSTYRDFKAYLFKKFLNQTIDGIASNSIYTQNFWKEKGVKTKNNRVIYNGVYFNNRYNKENVYQDFPHLRGKFIIGTTSRLISWKRVDILIKAFSGLTNSDSNTVLLIVGDGPEKEKLQALTKALKIQDQVTFTGYKSNVTDYQDAMDICVFASASEPFGLVAVECLHLGKPVLVMEDGGGLVEIIEKVDHRNIANSESELTSLLEKFTNNKDRDREEFNQRKTVAKSFSITNCEKNYWELYCSIVKYK
ncbi:glycosyltransferase family 4 protein [Mangrovibacterium diazotrophicum]|uniref:Glycosyltransferase involved in cell wall biosynthesis n=1 Tax=Mangrovibacterium diazotrophicum TaxID=1261403 RepID=A0A419W979_9BACT|nr:glycosyltransferase family 4 protein [Mangrovibacterium diazotrophicum]RKD92000.1 glycosyltransferase involved in cell wall biosynthesis [Mangrovibacterium diazotrophicum]